VVVVRQSPAADLEVLLVRRNDRVAFMAGAYVFPGGRVDAADHDAVPGARFLAEPARFPDLTVADELPYRVAAVRELAEEANVTVQVDDLLPFAHWVTPEIEIRRYDTRFFLTKMPEGQDARSDEGETTALVWHTPAAAIVEAMAGAIMLPPPTWTTLCLLARRGSLDAVQAWARTTPVVRVQPGFIVTGASRVLMLPGDPDFPAMDGWEVPDDTRFLLNEGRGWLPIRGAQADGVTTRWR
jgi:8-oxo-dGTP pyrophosphatase MutT (NUDIX family)